MQLLSYYVGQFKLSITVTEQPNQYENDMIGKVLTHSVIMQCVLSQHFDLTESDKNRNKQLNICTYKIILKRVLINERKNKFLNIVYHRRLKRHSLCGKLW